MNNARSRRRGTGLPEVLLQERERPLPRELRARSVILVAVLAHEGVAAVDAVIVVVSQYSAGKPWVRAELDAAVVRDFKIEALETQTGRRGREHPIRNALARRDRELYG